MCVCVCVCVCVCTCDLGISLPPFIYTYIYQIIFIAFLTIKSALVQMINYKIILIIGLMENASAFPSLLPFKWRKTNASSHIYPRASLVSQLVKNLPAMWETWVQSLGWEDPLEKEKSIHSSILAWGIPWTV